MSARQHREEGAAYFHEFGLAQLLAWARVGFSVANFPILYLDWREGGRGPESVIVPMFVGVLFLAYSILSQRLLVSKAVSLRQYQLWSPVGDVAASSGLILITGGYNSPFYLWLLFAVVATGFSPMPILSVLVASIAVTIQASIALIPQTDPLRADVTAARMVYTFGFGALVAAIGAYLRRLSATLSSVEVVSKQLGDVAAESDAMEMLPRVLAEHLPGARVLVRVPGREPFEEGSCKSIAHSVDCEMNSAGEHYGLCSAYRHRPFGWQESYFVRMACDRYISTVRRLRLAQRLVELATHQERLRFADDLHDKYLQTLAAVDLHAEAARVLGKGNEPLMEEVSTIKNLVREGAKKARSFIEEQEPSEHGPKAIRQILAQRWTGDHTLAIDRRVDLSESQWQCVEFLLKEGLNNAKRHGRASRVNLKIDQTDGVVRVRLEADGRAPSRESMFGYGLGRIAQMAEHCGGEVKLDGAPLGGSVLSAVFRSKKSA